MCAMELFRKKRNTTRLCKSINKPGAHKKSNVIEFVSTLFPRVTMIYFYCTLFSDVYGRTFFHFAKEHLYNFPSVQSVHSDADKHEYQLICLLWCRSSQQTRPRVQDAKCSIYTTQQHYMCTFSVYSRSRYLKNICVCLPKSKFPWLFKV